MPIKKHPVPKSSSAIEKQAERQWEITDTKIKDAELDEENIRRVREAMLDLTRAFALTCPDKKLNPLDPFSLKASDVPMQQVENLRHCCLGMCKAHDITLQVYAKELDKFNEEDGLSFDYARLASYRKDFIDITEQLQLANLFIVATDIIGINNGLTNKNSAEHKALKLAEYKAKQKGSGDHTQATLIKQIKDNGENFNRLAQLFKTNTLSKMLEQNDLLEEHLKSAALFFSGLKSLYSKFLQERKEYSDSKVQSFDSRIELLKDYANKISACTKHKDKFYNIRVTDAHQSLISEENAKYERARIANDMRQQAKRVDKTSRNEYIRDRLITSGLANAETAPNNTPPFQMLTVKYILGKAECDVVSLTSDMERELSKLGNTAEPYRQLAELLVIAASKLTIDAADSANLANMLATIYEQCHQETELSPQQQLDFKVLKLELNTLLCAKMQRYAESHNVTLVKTRTDKSGNTYLKVNCTVEQLQNRFRAKEAYDMQLPHLSRALKGVHKALAQVTEPNNVDALHWVLELANDAIKQNHDFNQEFIEQNNRLIAQRAQHLEYIESLGPKAKPSKTKSPSEASQVHHEFMLILTAKSRKALESIGNDDPTLQRIICNKRVAKLNKSIHKLPVATENTEEAISAAAEPNSELTTEQQRLLKSRAGVYFTAQQLYRTCSLTDVISKLSCEDKDLQQKKHKRSLSIN